MKIKVVYSVLEEQHSQLVKVPDELANKLEEWNNPHKAEEFLKKQMHEIICEQKNLGSHEVKIHEIYEKKQPKQPSEQGFER